jgi:hypothetical protein
MSDLNNSINVDGIEYDLNNLSDTAKVQVINIRFTDEKILQLKNEIAVADTARLGYLTALKGDLGPSREREN